MKHNAQHAKQTVKTMLSAMMMKHYRNIGHDDVQHVFEELIRLNGGDMEWDYKGKKS